MSFAGTVIRYLGVMGLVGLAGLGCKSGTDPASVSFASVSIQHSTTDQVKQATLAVFAENGYEVALSKGEQIVFEKQGSAMNQVAYGGWIAGQDVWVRVPVTIVPLAPGSHRVECRAYMVRNKGDTFFEEEVKLSRVRKKPYQKMLKDVAARLESNLAAQPPHG